MRPRETRELKLELAVCTLLAVAPMAMVDAASCSARVHTEDVAARISGQN